MPGRRAGELGLEPAAGQHASFRVPASSRAIQVSRKNSAARPMPSAPATPKALSVAWSWAASSARKMGP